MGVLVLGRFWWPGPTIILVRDALTIVGFVWLARRGVTYGEAKSILGTD